MASETSSVDKIESVAVVSSMCESPSPSVKTVTSSQKKAMKSKIKAVVAAVAATQAEEEDMYNLCVDHPYLSVLYKRIRSHRKKLEKIKGLAQAQANEGKVLNAQQLELMSNKAPLEKLVVELEMLREQFVVVFSQELEQKQQQKQQKTAVESVAEEMGPVQEKEESQEVVKQEEQVQEVEKEVQVLKETAEKQEDYANVYELLKTLHVVNLHQSLGKEVPMVLDFFSKMLLGNTRPPAEVSYEENLIESLEEAKKYLMKSDKVFACDTTYDSLRAFVDELANISSKKPEEEETMAGRVHEAKSSATVVEETLDVPVVPAEINMMPQISFFAESQLESEKDETASEKAAEVHAEITKVVAAEAQDKPFHEAIEKHEVRIIEQAQVQVEAPVVESVSAPPLSFAAVAAGVSNEGTPSPSASSGSSGNDKKELGPEGNSPQGKNTHRRQGRWREKGSNSNSGGINSGNGSPTKPRRSRAPRATDENSGVQGYKRFGSKEGGRPRVGRGSQKQDNSSQQHTAPMIAPHA